MSKRAHFGRWRGSGKTAPGRVAFSRQLRKAVPRLVAARPDTSERFAPQGYGHCRRAAFVMEHEDDKSIEYRVDPYAGRNYSFFVFGRFLLLAVLSSAPARGLP